MYNSSDQFYTEGAVILKKTLTGTRKVRSLRLDLVLQNSSVNFKLSTGLVVEVGCGAGEILLELMQTIFLQHSVLKGYDISPQAIEIASKKATPQLSFFLDDYSQIESREG